MSKPEHRNRSVNINRREEGARDIRPRVKGTNLLLSVAAS